MIASQAPAAFAGAPLFEPVAGLLSRFPDALPSAAQLTALLGQIAPDACAGSGRPIRFTLPPAELPAYEQHIHNTGAVPTRADNWHDFFNALAWCVWPQTKAACNSLHLREQQARAAAILASRGPVRDALTQFDECGVLVISTDPHIPALLAAHEWEAAFWQHRTQLIDTTRFLIFGHGTWDQLRQPYFGLCAKAIYRVVEAGWLRLPATQQQAEADAWLARRLTDPQRPFGKTDLSPLPLLGIPGLTPANETPDYYRDTRQFRPWRVADRIGAQTQR